MGCTRYEKYMRKSENAMKRAQKEKNCLLKAFYFKASKGFAIKAANLAVTEGEKLLKEYA